MKRIIIVLLILCASLAFAAPPTGPQRWRIVADGSVTPVGNRGITAATFLSLAPQSLTVTTEADLTLTGSVLLLTGDNDTDNDAIDLQNGTVTGQILVAVAAALVDANDTITLAVTDTTCTNCPTLLLDELSDAWILVWSGSTWIVVGNYEVP